MATDTVITPIVIPDVPAVQNTPVTNSTFWDSVVFTGRSVFVLYLVLAGQFLDPLFPCHSKRLLEESVLLRHALGFLTLLFFVVLIDDYAEKIKSMSRILVLCFGVYIWFVLSSKMTPATWITLLFILVTLYLTDLFSSRYGTLSKETQDWISWIHATLISIAAAVTGLGVTLYMGEKKLEYGKRFSYTVFFLGKNKCKNTIDDVPPLKALSAAFGF